MQFMVLTCQGDAAMYVWAAVLTMHRAALP